MKERKVRVKLIYELDIADWYEGEGLTKQQKLKQFKEEIADISVHCQHCNYETLVGCEVEEIK